MPHHVTPDSSQMEDTQMEDAPSPLLEQMEEDDAPTKPPGASVKLEEMFDVDSEDEELLSSALDSSAATNDNVQPSSPPQAQMPTSVGSSTNYSDPDIMLAFYQRLYPFRPIFQWLNHSPKPCNDFAHREFAFTLSNDAYLRYQSFPTADLLRKEVCRLNPSRFEIGPMYSTNPRDRKTLRKSANFRPMMKELVFDIDLTDYDEIRTCCTGANICNKCWKWVTMAIKVVDACLREDFGFEHILWVYSGRRGAHAWISDKRAREMGDDKRKALAGYLEVIKGGSQSGKKVNVRRPLHPHLARSLEVLKDHFVTDVLEDQDPWREEPGAEKLLTLLPDKELNSALRKKWASAPGRSSSSKWADIDSVAKAGASKLLDAKALLEAKKDVILEYTYPRLDVEVSKKLIHLLKAPFVIHPKTGRVCVPMDLSKLEKFDPLGVPKVTELLGEIDEWTGPTENEDGKTVQDYEKTSLKGYVELFKAHVSRMLKDERGVKQEKEDGDPMEF